MGIAAGACPGPCHGGRAPPAGSICAVPVADPRARKRRRPAFYGGAPTARSARRTPRTTTVRRRQGLQAVRRGTRRPIRMRGERTASPAHPASGRSSGTGRLGQRRGTTRYRRTPRPWRTAGPRRRHRAPGTPTPARTRQHSTTDPTARAAKRRGEKTTADTSMPGTCVGAATWPNSQVRRRRRDEQPRAPERRIHPATGRASIAKGNRPRIHLL